MVLGTRSALQSLMVLYIYSMLESLDAFTDILLLSENVLLKIWFGGKRGKGWKPYITGPYDFGFVKVWLLVTKLYYQFENERLIQNSFLR